MSVRVISRYTPRFPVAPITTNARPCGARDMSSSVIGSPIARIGSSRWAATDTKRSCSSGVRSTIEDFAPGVDPVSRLNRELDGAAGERRRLRSAADAIQNVARSGERVGRDNVGSGVQVAFVNRAHDFGIGGVGDRTPNS